PLRLSRLERGEHQSEIRLGPARLDVVHSIGERAQRARSGNWRLVAEHPIVEQCDAAAVASLERRAAEHQRRVDGTVELAPASRIGSHETSAVDHDHHVAMALDLEAADDATPKTRGGFPVDSPRVV